MNGEFILLVVPPALSATVFVTLFFIGRRKGLPFGPLYLGMAASAACMSVTNAVRLIGFIDRHFARTVALSRMSG